MIVDCEVTSLAISAEFLEPGTEYKLENLAIAENGNRTIVETTYVSAEEFIDTGDQNQQRGNYVIT